MSSNALLDPSTTIASFGQSLALDVRLVKALQSRLGLQRPTLVQGHAWPAALQQGRSCWIQAPTGSGKTLAYVVPAVQKILQHENNNSDDSLSPPRALILVPTRELCHQVQDVLQQVLHYCVGTVTTAILSVGVARGSQQQAMQARQWAALRDDPAVLVGTPAAVAMAMEKAPTPKSLWSAVRTVVLDEADLLLRLGHEPDLRRIVQTLPRLYQGMIVSATLPSDDKTDANGSNNNNNKNPMQSLPNWALLETPLVIKIEADETLNTNKPPALKQLYLPVKEADKYLVLYVFLKLGLLQGKGLFFVGTVNDGYRLKLFLQLFHIRAAVLNSELPLASRLHILQQFHAGNMDYLIATDQANDSNRHKHDDNGDDDDDDDKPKKSDGEYGVARGVDFHRVSFVVNVDFPPNPNVYRHRIGRTARGGRSGVALSLVATDSSLKVTTSSKKKKRQSTSTAPPQLSDWELLQLVQEDQPRIPLIQAAAQTHTIMHATAAPRAGSDDNHNKAVIDDAPTNQAQPILLDFDLQEIEGFRYRVEDVSRAVTRKAVQEARTSELKAEILNSERLQQHFAANPADAKLLQHDRPAATLQAPDHLKHVPKYLLPKGMQVANLNKKRKRKKRNLLQQQDHRASKDPLQCFRADVNLDGVAGVDEDGTDEDADEAMAMNDNQDGGPVVAKRAKTEPKVFSNTRDGTGKSTSGRNAWKERHHKGKFSNKTRKKDRGREPLGI